jgi:hypothetical protein
VHLVVLFLAAVPLRSAFPLSLSGKFIPTGHVETSTSVSKSRVILPMLLQAKTFAENTTGELRAWLVMSMGDCLQLIVRIEMFMMMIMMMSMVMIVFTGDHRELNEPEHFFFFSNCRKENGGKKGVRPKLNIVIS